MGTAVIQKANNNHQQGGNTQSQPITTRSEERLPPVDMTGVRT